MININYRKKYYEENNIVTSYYAQYSNKNIVLLSMNKDKTRNQDLKIVFHNIKDKSLYDQSVKKIENNENFMITKHEYDRLFKMFRKEFQNNCFS